MIIYFFNGLAFGGLGLAAYLQLRRGGEFPLRTLLPWLASFGITAGAAGWVEMFMENDSSQWLQALRVILYPGSGLLLLIFGWGIFARLMPLPNWMIFIPGILLIPGAYVLTYALSTFITPSPVEIPIDIWSRYLLYLPGSILAGVGFLRQWNVQKRLGYRDVASLMLGAGLAFLFEAFVVGLVVPAAPYGPASYYNYDRVIYDAFVGESGSTAQPYGMTLWLDYSSVLATTGLPIQFWRMLSAFAVTFFVVRGLDVFENIRRRQVRILQGERDQAQQTAIESQILARQTAENWSDALVQISRRVAELEDVDTTLLYIVNRARTLLGADFMGLALVESDFSRFTLKCYATETEHQLVDSPVMVENPLIMRAIESGDLYFSHGDEAPFLLRGACFHAGEAASLAAVCLKLDAQPVGALWVACYHRHAFSETDGIWLGALADQVVISIKHGIMTSQLQSLSVIDERARIAREMHDGLAQVLGYLNVQVQTVDAFMQQGKLDKAQTKLEQMRQAVQLAHADVRENILSLRTTLDHEKGVIPGIQEYLEEFGLQTNVATCFSHEFDGELNLPAMAEVQLVCVLREALTNVRKHAQANRVEVTLSRHGSPEEAHVVLRICDDGIGFVESEQKRHFGLQTMSERAQSVDGALFVSSVLGRGTQVECWIPCLRQERLKSPALVAYS
jgi:signal transduction histidine kinase